MALKERDRKKQRCEQREFKASPAIEKYVKCWVTYFALWRIEIELVGSITEKERWWMAVLGPGSGGLERTDR